MMLNLIFKDILIQKKSFLYSILFGLAMIAAFQKGQGNSAYIVGALAIVYYLTAGAFAYDEKNKADMLINSLPVNRKYVVTARYASLLVFSIIALVIVSLLGAAINFLGIPNELSYINLIDIAAMLLLSSVMFSIYIPICFKFGYVKTRLVNIILYVVILAASSAVSAIVREITASRSEPVVNDILMVLTRIPNWMMGPIFVLLILLIIFISLSISIKVYSKREF